MLASAVTSGYTGTLVVYYLLPITLLCYFLKLSGIIESLRSKVAAQVILRYVPDERKIPEVIETKIDLFKSLKDFKPAPKILEVGAGDGSNLQFYPKGSRYVVVEPNENFHPHLKKRVAEVGSHLQLEAVYADAAEKLANVEDDSVDAYVMTHVTCEVVDLDAVLREARRVLKPGGSLYVYHHLMGPDVNRRSLQVLVERYIFYGLLERPFSNCRVDRDIEADVLRYFPDAECKFMNIPYPEIIIRGHQVIEAKKTVNGL